MKVNAMVSIREVTPELALEWLSNKLDDQRELRQNHVNGLVAEMMAGKFRTGPDAILIVNGKLANGQHRLAAVVASGKKQTFIVMESNDVELFKVIDCGAKRHVYDAFSNVKNSRSVASIARWVSAHEHGTLCAFTKDPTGIRSKRPMTQQDLIEYCIEHMDILQEASSFVTSLYSSSHAMPVSLGGALYVIAWFRGEPLFGKCKSFLEELYVTGGTSSATELRNKLNKTMLGKARLPYSYQFALLLKTFKSYLDGRRMRVLKFSDTEEYPYLD